MQSAEVGVGEAVKNGEHGGLCNLTPELSGITAGKHGTACPT
jgi:hypothetical protein